MGFDVWGVGTCAWIASFLFFKDSNVYFMGMKCGEQMNAAACCDGGDGEGCLLEQSSSVSDTLNPI